MGQFQTSVTNHIREPSTWEELLLTRLDLCLRRLEYLDNRVRTLERRMGKLAQVVRA